MPRFKILWLETTEYKTFIDAPDEAEARRLFDLGEIDTPTPTGHVDTEEDSITITKVKD